MATKLKNLQLTSVDLVRAGANQEADICLFKSAGDDIETADPTEQETGIFKQFISWLRGNYQDEHDESADTIEKDYITFDQINSNRETNETLWRYTEALNRSLHSIQEDAALDAEKKAEMMRLSLQQFCAAMSELIDGLVGKGAIETKSCARKEIDMIVEKA